MHSERDQAIQSRGTARIVHRLLTGLVSFVCRHPHAVLVVALLAAGISAYTFYSHLEYHTQRSDLINPHKPQQERWRQHLKEFADDDDMVVVVKGADTQQMTAALEALAVEIRRQPEHFDRLFYKVDLRHLKNRVLLLLPEKQISQIQTCIHRMKDMLEPPVIGPVDPMFGWRSLTLTHLILEGNKRASQLSNRPRTVGSEQQLVGSEQKTAVALSDEDSVFWAQFRDICQMAALTLNGPAAYKNPWRRMVEQPADEQDMLDQPHYFFSDDKVLAFLLVQPVKVPGSFTASHPSVLALREIIDRLRPKYAALEFGLTGLPVLETDEMVAAERDTQLAMWLAISGVAVLFLVVYRGIYYPLLTVATLMIGTAWAMGWMTLTVGHLNILSATFAVMLIGMGDYGVLWVMRYDQARRSGADVRTALLHTTTHVAIGNLTAATTLALAFYAAMLADFQAVAELGWIAGSGVLLCALACFTVLPACLMIFDRRRLESTREKVPCTGQGQEIHVHCQAGDEWLPGLFRRPRWIVAGGLVLTLALGGCIFAISYDHNLLHLQPRDLDSVKWEGILLKHTAGASWHALSSAPTAKDALALKERYEQYPEVVGRVVEVASLVPPDQDSKLPKLADIQRRLQKLPPRGKPIPHPEPNVELIKMHLASLSKRLEPFTDCGQQPVLADVRASLAALAVCLDRLPQEKALKRLEYFEDRLAGDLAEDLHRLRDVSTPEPIQVVDLPPELRERYIGKTGRWLLQIFPSSKESLWDFPPLQKFTKEILEIDPQATGKPFTTVEGLRAMKDGLQWAGLYAFIAIVSVLFVDFRGWRMMVLALTPLIMGITLSLGIMGLFGVPLNPANMIAFPLILGVGVDNGVHVLHDYLIRRRKGQSTISHAIGRGVLVKALTTIIGFGTLMVSRQRGLVGLGLVLTLGVTCCMLTALVFLPALLRMWDRAVEPAIVDKPRRKAA